MAHFTFFLFASARAQLISCRLTNYIFHCSKEVLSLSMISRIFMISPSGNYNCSGGLIRLAKGVSHVCQYINGVHPQIRTQIVFVCRSQLAN